MSRASEPSRLEVAAIVADVERTTGQHIGHVEVIDLDELVAYGRRCTGCGAVIAMSFFLPLCDPCLQEMGDEIRQAREALEG